MRGLVRHHDVVRGLGRPAAVAAALGALVFNVLLFLRDRGTGAVPPTGQVAVAFAFLLPALAVLLLARPAGRRAAAWALPLPVPARTLWTAHLRALVLAVSLVLLTMGAVLALLLGLLAWLSETAPPDPATVLLLGVRPWLVLVLAAATLTLWRPGLADPGHAVGWGRWRLGVGLGAAALLAVLLALPLPAGLVPAFVLFPLLARTAAGLPPALALAERPEAPAAAAGAAAGDAPPPHGPGVLGRVIRRQLFKWPATWVLGLPMVGLLGLLLGGEMFGAGDSAVLRYFNVYVTAYLLVAFNGHFLENLWRVDHLPLRRGMLLRWLLLPGAATLLLGALLGAAVTPHPAGETLAYENDPQSDTFGLHVSLRAWETVWGDPPAAVTAPWGETGWVAHADVVAGGPLHLWKPYTTTPAASPRFVAWQISRALSRIHGVAVPPDTLAERYLTVGADGVVRVRDAGLTPVADGLVPPAPLAGPVVPLLLTVVLVLSLGTTAVTFRLCGPGLTRRRLKVVTNTALGVLMTLHLGGYALLMARMVRPWVLEGLVVGVAGRVGALGAVGWVGAWVLLAVVLAAGWWACARTLRHVEAVRVESGRCFL